LAFFPLVLFLINSNTLSQLFPQFFFNSSWRRAAALPAFAVMMTRRNLPALPQCVSPRPSAQALRALSPFGRPTGALASGGFRVWQISGQVKKTKKGGEANADLPVYQ
jgi:hypothetical protein